MEFETVHENEIECIKPECPERNKIADDGTCEVCPDYEILLENKVEC